jgi:hypothetical protein
MPNNYIRIQQTSMAFNSFNLSGVYCYNFINQIFKKNISLAI